MTTTFRFALSRSSFAAALLLALAMTGATTLSAQAASAAASDSVSGWARALLGRWGCAGAFASGRPLAADVSFTLGLHGHWLEYHHTDPAPGQYQASAFLGAGLR